MTRLHSGSALLVAACSLLFAPRAARAQWLADGTPVSTEIENQYDPAAAPDGAGGMIVTWLDNRGPYGRQIFAQRLDASGTPLWTADGVPVCLGPGSNSSPAIVSDGAGGAIIAWHGSPVADDDIFALRLDAAGNAVWNSNGVAVCSASGEQLDPELVPDGAGGAVIVWQDLRNDAQGDLYAQRVGADGTMQWSANGEPLCTAAREQARPGIASDGAGGVIAAWEDYRNGAGYNIFAQRLDAAGAAQWSNTVAVTLAPHDQYTPAVVEDGAGGAVVVWSDLRSGAGAAIYAQRLNGAGVAQWDTGGVALDTVLVDAAKPRAVADGAGGAIVAWQGLMGTANFVEAQHVSASGAMLYDPSGIRLTDASGSESSPSIATDGAGGAIVAWTDSRAGFGTSDIFTQRVTGSGELLWGAAGLAVCTAPFVQLNSTIAPGPPGSAIVAWADRRSNTSYDVYAERPDTSSVVAVAPEPSPGAIRVAAVRPNPTRAAASLDFDLAAPQRVSVEVFDIGGRLVRRVATNRSLPAGRQTLTWDGLNDRGVAASAGVYCIRLKGSGFAAMRRVAIVR
jgi:FlgD Ig-like domain